jgi:hypothetical protein
MNRKIFILAICALVLFGCARANVPATPPLATCIIPGGRMTATVTGTGVNPATNQTSDVRTVAKIDNPSGNTITWSNGGLTTSTDPISGTSGNGTVTPVRGNPQQYSVNVSYNAGGNNISIDGTINTGGNVCAGGGTWTAVGPNRRNAGNGTWSVP